MIQIVLVFCQIANATACETRMPGIDLDSVHECMILGPQIAAQDPFLAMHPDYHLVRYGCMNAHKQTQL